METRKEYRFLRQSELRATGDSLTVSGYSAVFDVPSLPMGPQRYREYIRPQAFDRSLGGDILALYDHQGGNVLGRSSAGTLRLSTDSVGLKTEIDLPPTQLGRDTHALIQRRDLKGMSIGFHIVKDRWNDSHTTRELLDVDLGEISIVSHPAYPQTSITARSIGLPEQVEFLVYEGVSPEPVSDDEKRRLELKLGLLRRL